MTRKNNYLVLAGLILCVGMQAPLRAQNYSVGQQFVNKQRWVTLEVGPKRLVVFGIPMVAGGGNLDKRLRALVREQLPILYKNGILEKKENYRVSLIRGEPTVWVSNPERVGGLPAQVVLVTVDRSVTRSLGKERWDIAYYWRDMLTGPALEELAAPPPGSSGASEFRPDPVGRPLDHKNSWRLVPDRFADTYLGKKRP